jgi:integrase
MAHVRHRPDRPARPWEVRYRAPDGRERSQSFARKIEADRFRATTEADQIRGEWSDPRLGEVPFGEWAERWQAGRLNLAPSTRDRDGASFRNLILPTFGAVPLARIEPAAVREWVASLDAVGYAPATVRKAHQLLAAALEAAVGDGLIPKTPSRGVSLPRLDNPEKRFLTEAEVSALAAAIRPRYRALVLTGAYTGLRPGELFALRVGNLDLLRRILRVTETLRRTGGRIGFGPPKSRAGRRTVSIPPFLVDELAAHVATYPGDDGLVFSAPHGGMINPPLFRRRFWIPAVEASVGEPCTPHDLRHTHVALLIAAGEHPYVISRRLGHASIKTTFDVYGHLFEGLDEAAAGALEEMGRRTLAGPPRDGGPAEVIELPSRSAESQAP